MRKGLLILNYLALFAAMLAWFYVAWIASLGGPVRVTELDRNQVIDEAKLRKFSPQLAENLRGNVGNWIQEPTRSTAVLYAQCLAGLALLNIVGCHLLGRKRSGDKQPAGVDPACPKPA